MKKSLRKQHSKVCSVCGIRKPLNDFILNPTALIKDYSSTCLSCRSKLAKTTPKSGDDDEDSGGKGRGLAVDFLTKWLHLRDQTHQAEKNLDYKKELRIKFGKAKKYSPTSPSPPKKQKSGLP